MKNALFVLTLAGSLLLLNFRLHSFAQAGGSPRQSLQALKETNLKIIEQQTATLEKLDEVGKDATQLRTFSKRS